MINIGTEIGGYKVIAMANGYALAKSETAPNPFVVWTIDDDGEGVCIGHYFNECDEAEWDFCARAFEWFEDNMNITLTEDTTVSESASEADTELFHEYLDGIRAARDAIAKAAQMVEEMCDELDKLRLRAVIPIKLNNGIFSGIIDGINSINQRVLERSADLTK